MWQSVSGCAAELMPLLGKGLGTTEFFRQTRELGKSHSLPFLPVQCLQFKIINAPVQRMLGWHVLNSYSHILRWHMLPLSMRLFLIFPYYNKYTKGYIYNIHLCRSNICVYMYKYLLFKVRQEYS